MILTDVSKQLTRDADTKTMQKIKFTGNLVEAATIFFILEEVKQTILDFSKGTFKGIVNLFCFNKILI